MKDPADRLIVALDVATVDEARRLVEKLAPTVRWFKIGKQLFTAHGPTSLAAVREVGGKKIFLDLKFHDIPATVASAIRSAAAAGADMVNVHALGGLVMMKAAAAEGAAIKKETGAAPLLIAVTVLTSMRQSDLMALGIDATPQMLATHLAGLAKEAGLAGVVSSPQEAAAVHDRCGARFLTVTPGVRPAWAAKNDQARVMTPAAAVANGADYLVVGRPVIGAKNPVEAAKRILDEMAG
jgi:orotidine-5'-phosphate decarboxylase